MMTPAAFALGALAGPAAAIDLAGLSGQSKRDACGAYVVIDLEIRHRTGAMSDADYDAQSNALVWKLWGKNRANAAALERRVDAMIGTIAAEEPTNGEIATQARTCRTYLGL